MDLPQVHVIGAEAVERGVQRREQRPPRRVWGIVGTGHARLGRDDDLVAREDIGEEPAEYALTGTIPVGRRGVDEGASSLDEGAQRSSASCSSVSRPHVMVPGAVGTPAGRFGRGDAAPWPRRLSRAPLPACGARG